MLSLPEFSLNSTTCDCTGDAGTSYCFCFLKIMSYCFTVTASVGLASSAVENTLSADQAWNTVCCCCYLLWMNNCYIHYWEGNVTSSISKDLSYLGGTCLCTLSLWVLVCLQLCGTFLREQVEMSDEAWFSIFFALFFMIPCFLCSLWNVSILSGS